MFKKILKNNKGQLLLEILIVISVAAIVGSIATQLVLANLHSSKWSTESNVAEGLLEEMIEGAGNAAFARWQDIYSLNKGVDNHYSAAISGTAWSISAGDESVALNGISYTRYFYVTNVCRDNTSKAIITTEGVPPCTAGNSDDPSSQKITAIISWDGGSIEKKEYLTRWRNRICDQTSWTGSGSGAKTCPDTTFESSTNIDYTGTPGSLKLESQ